MKKTVYADDFVRAFDDYNRGDNFSKAGRYALFNWFDQMESEGEQEFELDVIAICCDFSEYESAFEAGIQYGTFQDILEDKEKASDEPLSDDEKEALALEYLEENTVVIPFDGGVIIQNF